MSCIQWCFPFSELWVSLGDPPHWVLGTPWPKEGRAAPAQAAVGAQTKCPAQAFSWWPKPEGLLTEASPGHLMPPPNMPGETGKQSSLSWAILLPRTLICAELKARTPKSELQRCQNSPAVLLPVWAVVAGAALSRGCGITKLKKWSDHMTTGHCKGEELLIRLCLTGVTYTLWLWHWHLLILFSNLLHKLANQMVSFNSPLNKEASPCTGNKVYLISTQFEDQKEVCLTLHYFHFLIFTGFCSSCYQRAQKAELIGKTLPSAAGAENVISQTDGILWWLAAPFLWASDEEFSHENVMNFHK